MDERKLWRLERRRLEVIQDVRWSVGSELYYYEEVLGAWEFWGVVHSRCKRGIFFE